MRKIDEIIVHCSATPASMNIGVKEIREWHLERGFNDVGYHYVIRRDGTIEKGRPVEKAGAHCKGHNAHSIGICLVGGTATGSKRGEINYTGEQWDTLRRLIDNLKSLYPAITKLSSHREYANKFCPGFLAQAWYETGTVKA